MSQDAADAPVVGIDRGALADALVAALERSAPLRVNQVEHRMPPEPWSYSLLAGVGLLFAGVGLLFTVAGVLAFIGGLVMVVALTFAPVAGLTLAGLTLMAISLPLFLTAAVQLLGVDVARNIRAMRYHQH